VRDRRFVLAGLGALGFGGRRAAAEPSPARDEAGERKRRSEAILAAEGIPYIAHLPVVGAMADTRFRTVEETANRALSLTFVAVMGESGDYDLVQRLIREWNVRAHLTPNERRFVDSRTPSMHDRTQFSWRYEALWPLVWALGFVNEIGRPDHIVDVPALVALIQEQGPDGFRANARLRERGQILDALDLTYRYHWAVVDARLNGREPPGRLDPGVVMERHYALNWLTCYADQEWDYVSTDT
jgi:hypothetical protein